MRSIRLKRSQPNRKDHTFTIRIDDISAVERAPDRGYGYVSFQDGTWIKVENDEKLDQIEKAMGVVPNSDRMEWQHRRTTLGQPTCDPPEYTEYEVIEVGEWEVAEYEKEQIVWRRRVYFREDS